jgi:ribosomal protein S18 acetylase RimI-like enzyme
MWLTNLLQINIMPIELTKAANYTIQELVDAYNQTRVDYMVPMPMNAARLAEYIQIYDLDLEQSLVAKENGTLVGLGMLGIRPERSWITRLGLVANQRGKGVGQALMEGLLQNSDILKIPQVYLEVIKGNKPAHNLFQKLGFESIRELLILRRAPKKVPIPKTKIYPMDRGDIIFHLNKRSDNQAWTNQTETLGHLKGMSGYQIYSEDHGHGWMVYQKTLFNISRLMFDTDQGDPVELMRELLAHLHHLHPNMDTYTENIPADDPRLPAFEEFGYIEAFSRVEMYRFPDLT